MIILPREPDLSLVTHGKVKRHTKYQDIVSKALTRTHTHTNVTRINDGAAHKKENQIRDTRTHTHTRMRSAEHRTIFAFFGCT